MAVAQVCADLCRAHAASVRTATDAQWAVGTELAQAWPLRLFYATEYQRLLNCRAIIENSLTDLEAGEDV